MKPEFKSGEKLGTTISLKKSRRVEEIYSHPMFLAVSLVSYWGYLKCRTKDVTPSYGVERCRRFSDPSLFGLCESVRWVNWKHWAVTCGFHCEMGGRELMHFWLCEFWCWLTASFCISRSDWFRAISMRCKCLPLSGVPKGESFERGAKREVSRNGRGPHDS